jgi:hypothetical protein
LHGDARETLRQPIMNFAAQPVAFLENSILSRSFSQCDRRPLLLGYVNGRAIIFDEITRSILD